MRRALTAAALLLLSSPLLAATADLRYVDGIADLTGSCFLRTTRLSAERPEGLTEPAYRGEPLYGTLPLAGEGFPVVLDRGAEGGPIVYVDPDRSGDLVEVAWEARRWDGKYLGSAFLELSYGEGERSPYRVFLLWDPLYPTVLVYCRDGRREGEISLDGVTYRLAVIDEDTDGRYDDLAEGSVYLDLDQDGVLLASDDSHEYYRLDEPFNLHGTVYEVISLARDGSSITIEQSATWVEEKPPLEPGHPAPAFAGVGVNGEETSLASLRGRVVLLDFWASWCVPCLVEIPVMKEIATRFAEKGLVVLGINADLDEGSFLEAFDLYELPYPQIYDGKEGAIAALYRIFGIPMTYLIDQDGTIRGKGLRGEDLVQALEELFKE